MSQPSAAQPTPQLPIFRRFSHFGFLLGLLLLFLLLRTVDLPQSLDLLENSDPLWLAAALLFLAPEVLFKAWRIRSFAHRFHSPLSILQSAWVYLSGQPLSAVTPSKLGDVVRVVGLSRLGGFPLTTALSLHVADKVYDLLALGILASVGLISLLLEANQQTPALAVLSGIAAGILLMLLFLNPNWMRSLVKPFILSLAPKKLARSLEAHGHSFYQKLQELFAPASRIGLPFFLSVLAWEAAIVRAYFCARALHVPIPFSTIALLLPVVVVIEFVPISILGFGTREAALFLFFTTAQVGHSALISFSVLLVLIGPVATALLGIPAAIQLGSMVQSKKP